MTEIITGGRQTGRTTRLIEMAAEAEERGECVYIVCHTQREAYRIAQHAETLGKRIRFPLSYDEFLQREYHGRHIKKFYIDNGEMLLQRLTEVPIAAITMEVSDA